ncbi:hypothetical protein [Jeongeupia chitinilytica]|uniref:Uncharacterized protein n=1 Tax=Jeongeupia chitinilytica TaxID=1041641 RepID=A0ABQ3GUX4_9NEIS|nr:hypothetical protein [Jeongeupia chitinilytica]GHD56183.1 hypothetical protein GCM10007350_02770 [Jeongeupia chitinilytica]
MSRAKVVEWEMDTLNGEQGWRYQNAFMTSYRAHHILLHTIMDPNRQGVQPHGMWIRDYHYSSLDEMIWAYAAKCVRRINSVSSRVTQTINQTNGRYYYRVRLSTDAHVGIADIESDRALNWNIRGLWYAYTQYADIVFDPLAHTDSGHAVYPIVTFYPVQAGDIHASGLSFIESADYQTFNQRRW